MSFKKFLTDYHTEFCTLYNQTSRAETEDKNFFEGKRNASNDILEKFTEDNLIAIPADVFNQIVRYCEDQAIFDKLASYGDFYYKLKQIEQ